LTKPLVWVVSTGGTIASRYDAKLGGHVAAATAAELLATVPELAGLAEVRSIEHSRINSPGLDSPTVFSLGQVLRGLLAMPDAAGAVVTHGTATLEETAYLLDLTVGSEKPVVVTGAQRDFDERDPDGPRNLLYAVKIAADPASRGRGVLVSLGGQIHAAREAVKANTLSLDAFASRDGGKIGMVSKERVVFFSWPERRIHLDVDHLKTNVQLVVMAQGSNDLLLRACIAARVDGLVVDAVGAGNMNLSFYHAVCDALAAGIPVVISSRHQSGPPYASKGYPGSLKSVLDAGAINAGYLSGLKARILLMVALAKTGDREALRGFFAQVG
jgi:L-asparaginase